MHAVEPSLEPRSGRQSPDLRILRCSEQMLAIALVATFIGVTLAGRRIDPFVLGAAAAVALVMVRWGNRVRSDTRLHVMLSLVFIIDVSLTFYYLDGYGVDIVWLFVLPVGAGLLGRWQHIAVWSTAVAAAFLVMFIASSPEHLMWHNPTTLPNLVGTSAILFLIGFGMLWSRRISEAKLRGALVEANELADKHAEAEQRVRNSEHARHRLLATMSHELRTPMSGIVLAADALDPERLELADRNMLNAIRTSADSMVELLNELFALAQLEPTGNTDEVEPFDLVAIVEGVAALATPSARRAGLNLVVDLDPAMPRTWIGNAKHIQRAMLNLVNHAIEHTAFGSVRLLAHANEGLFIRIDDTGDGMDTLAMSSVFDPTTQANEVPDALGSDLGLLIARDIVLSMGGTLEAHSEPLAGSAFTFTLPLEPHTPTEIGQTIERPLFEGQRTKVVANSGWAIAAANRWLSYWGATPEQHSVDDTDLLVLEAEGDVDEPSGYRGLAAFARHCVTAVAERGIDPTDATPEPPGRNGGITCLVVDDDAVAQTVIAATLMRQGYHTVVADNGAEALRVIEGRPADDPIDIMFLDLTMPVMDGIEALKRLRCDGGPHAHLPVCVVSGTSIEHHEVIGLGADEFLLKPPRGTDLQRTVERLVTRR